MDDVAPLYMTIETIACDRPPEVAVRHLCRLADRVGIAVRSDVSGIEVTVWPDTNERFMAERYSEAVRRKVKWVMSNAIPAAAEATE